MIDARAAILNATAAHFEASIAAAAGRVFRVVRGFPESDQPFPLGDDEVGSVLTIFLPDRLPVEWSASAFEDLEEVGPGGLPLWLARCGQIGGVAQLDLWSSHRAVRDLDALAVSNALHTKPEHRPGLYLEAPEYYDRRVVLTPDGFTTGDVEASPSEGLWRQTWHLAIQCDVVIPFEGPRLSTYTLIQSYGPEGLELPEPDAPFP